MMDVKRGMLDWNALERRLGREVGIRYAAGLRAEIPRRMEEVLRAMEAGDMSVVERLAHSLQGMAANLHIPEAQAAALAVEEAARNQDMGRLPALVAAMAESMSRVTRLLEEGLSHNVLDQREEVMRILVAEDDFSARLVLQRLLKDYGTVDVAVDGREAVDAFGSAMDVGEPYRLVCLDIMMPEMDGLDALRQIRAMEERQGILSTQGAKIIMTTALDDPKSVVEAFRGLCDTYLVKPIDKENLRLALVQVGVVGE